MNNNFFVEVTKKKTSYNKVQEMSKGIKEICTLLMQSTSDFDDETGIQLINDYIQKHERLLYSVISNYIFSLDNQQQGIFTTNLDSLVEFVLSDEYIGFFNEKLKEMNVPKLIHKKNLTGIEKILNERLIKEQTDKQCRSIKKTVLKLWDHVHLALYQFENLKQSDEEFKKKFIENIQPVKKDVNTELIQFTKTMNSQLISLIGIFTAMSFLVFGGMNSLDNIFTSIKHVPILELIIVGCVWGLCIMNLVFTFMFFISKLTKLNIKSNENNNATIIQKYPLVIWSNIIICTIMAFFSWIYFIDKENLGWWFIKLGREYEKVVSIGGFFIISILFFMFIKIIFSKKKYKTINNYKDIDYGELTSFKSEFAVEQIEDNEIIKNRSNN